MLVSEFGDVLRWRGGEWKVTRVTRVTKLEAGAGQSVQLGLVQAKSRAVIGGEGSAGLFQGRTLFLCFEGAIFSVIDRMARRAIDQSSLASLASVAVSTIPSIAA